MSEDVRMLMPDKRIDCTGLFCPLPIVKTREAIRDMAVGQVLEMLSDDPGSDPDMRTWAQITGHEFLAVSREGGLFRFLVRKSR
jgi:TusA-related sulfurtransferase